MCRGVRACQQHRTWELIQLCKEHSIFGTVYENTFACKTTSQYKRLSLLCVWCQISSLFKKNFLDSVLIHRDRYYCHCIREYLWSDKASNELYAEELKRNV